MGSFGRHHARALRDLEGATASGVFDIDAGRGRRVGRELGLPVRASLAELLAASDAVVVATPTAEHESVAMRAMRAGLAVLVEKPIAPDAAAARRMIRTADRLGVVLQVGHIERFNPALRAAAPYLERPLFVECERLSPFVARSLEVPVVMDLMIHDLDLLCSLVGAAAAVRVAATGSSVMTTRTDAAEARIDFAGGAAAKLTASRVATRRARILRVRQSSGLVELDLDAGRGEARLDGRAGRSANGAPPAARAGRRVAIAGDGAEPLALELAAFRDAAAGLAPPAVTGQDGLRALELAEIIERRIEEHVAHSGAPSP